MTTVTRYVYAGFTYRITEHAHAPEVGDYFTRGRPPAARYFTVQPEPGQHHAAAKDRHLRNALDSFLETREHTR